MFIGEGGLFAIAEELDNGEYRGITHYYDIEIIIKVCADMIRSFTYQLDRGDKVVVPYINNNNVVPETTAVVVGPCYMRKYLGFGPIGAHCQIRYLDSKQKKDVYISFSQDFETGMNGSDSFGVLDDNIFYFAEAGLEELKDLKAKGNGEFIVLSYELAYGDHQDGYSHRMELSDQRESNGKVSVDFGVDEGDIDDILSTVIQVDTIPGTETNTQCIHLSNGEMRNLSIFKTGNSYILRLEDGMTINQITLEDGTSAYALE